MFCVIIDNKSSFQDNLAHYLTQIVVPIKTALCDEDEEVRDSAAETFHVFYNVSPSPSLLSR